MGQRAGDLQLPASLLRQGRIRQSWVHWACGLQEHPSPPSSPESLCHKEEIHSQDMTKWNSNDLMDKMENPEPEESQGKKPWG